MISILIAVKLSKDSLAGAHVNWLTGEKWPKATLETKTFYPQMNADEHR